MVPGRRNWPLIVLRASRFRQTALHHDRQSHRHHRAAVRLAYSDRRGRRHFVKAQTNGCRSCVSDRRGRIHGAPRTAASMSADALLSHLDGVKHTGPGRWLARCPAHPDKHPSLAIRELDDGRVLLKCFAECDTESVLAAVGLTFDALFPPRAIDHHKPRERRPFPAADVLRCIDFEALICVIAASDMANGETLPESERERLMTAAARISAAVEASGHA